jgi:hypothetical protein
MEDFYNAGGVPALLHELSPLLHLDIETISGASVRETIADAQVINRDVIRTQAQAMALVLAAFPGPDESLGDALDQPNEARPDRVALVALGSASCQLVLAQAAFQVALKAGRGASWA